MHEEHRVGIQYLETVTALLQRARSAHPTKGLYEAAELQWWWTIPRPTDALDQLFWFDETDRPVAAVIANDWGDGSSAVYEETTLVLSVMPEASPDWVSHVVERGIAHAADSGIGAVELEVDRVDDVLRDLLFGHGFAVKEDGLIECWLAVEARPEISPLDADYRLCSRRDTTDRPHHMTNPSRPQIEERLHQTSLYRSDLDLVVFDCDDNPAAYGLFWYDPVTATGVVEPMRTHADHLRLGLGRHILTTGIDLLARAGAERISIGFHRENPASSHLYLSVGFEPHRRTDVFSGRVNARAS